jgi:hypothetical protein
MRRETAAPKAVIQNEVFWLMKKNWLSRIIGAPKPALIRSKSSPE